MTNIALIATIIFSTWMTPDWGANGHRIVADVCEKHLTERAKEGIREILGDEYLAEAANWPDYIKSERGWKFADPWHYTTVNSNQTVADVKNWYGKDSTINDAIEAIELMKAILKDDASASSFFEKTMKMNRARPLNNSTKATALAFLVHLIGDIHQPLHVGKNRDLGGNKISVLFFHERTNLHAVWDTEIIEHERLSYTEFSSFIDKLSPQAVAEYQNDSVEDWAWESIELRERIYNTIYDYTDRESGLPSFSWQYQHDYIQEVEKRLVQGGVRLAGILNAIFE